MIEFKGTKGEWTLTNEGIYGRSDNYQKIKGGCEYYDANNPNLGFALSGYISKENALLISKAPQMLEMLEELLIDLQSEAISTSMNDTINRTKQLIKEATEL